MSYAMCSRPKSKSHIYKDLLVFFLGPFPSKYWFCSNFSFGESLVLGYRYPTRSSKCPQPMLPSASSLAQ